MISIRDVLRKQLRQKRAALSKEQCEHAANTALSIVGNSWLFRRSKRVAFYAAVGNELDPSLLVQEAWRQGKTCYLPVCHPFGQNRLLFVPYYPHDSLSINRFGIPEPSLKKHSPISAWALDLVCVPLLGVDVYGHRLGSGLGYYDRTFSYKGRHHYYHRPHLLGLAYDFQYLNNLPAQSWDVPLDTVAVMGVNTHTTVVLNLHSKKALASNR